MTIGWGVASRLTAPLAARVATGPLYYVGLAVVVVILVWTLVVAYRHWEEMNDVEEPDSPADLLESFRQAHAEGELDDHELDRVRTILSNGRRRSSRSVGGNRVQAAGVSDGRFDPVGVSVRDSAVSTWRISTGRQSVRWARSGPRAGLIPIFDWRTKRTNSATSTTEPSSASIWSRAPPWVRPSR